MKFLSIKSLLIILLINSIFSNSNFNINYNPKDKHLKLKKKVCKLMSQNQIKKLDFSTKIKKIEKVYTPLNFKQLEIFSIYLKEFIQTKGIKHIKSAINKINCSIKKSLVSKEELVALFKIIINKTKYKLKNIKDHSSISRENMRKLVKELEEDFTKFSEFIKIKSKIESCRPNKKVKKRILSMKPIFELL